MDVLDGLLLGFATALEPINIFYVILGVSLGTFFGLLPGIGHTAGVALLLPLTYTMEPASGIIMLAGIYYGSMYGGRIPAILLRLPGDSSSVMTTLDGYPLTQQGRGGSALGITAIASFLGGTIAIIGLTVLAPSVAKIGRYMAAPELFLLMLFGMTMIVIVGSGRLSKSILMALVGIAIAMIGVDPITGSTRMTFGSTDLSGGIGVVPLAVGLFGIAEILNNMATRSDGPKALIKVGRVLPTWGDWVATRTAIARASVIGFFIGVLPGGGGTVSSVVSYGVQKKFSKNPDMFGKGAIDGLAATETADNASSTSAFVPLLTLGLPPNPVLGLIFGALLLQNITPGPQLVTEHPDIFWGVIASMYIGNIALLVLNLPLIRVFVSILKIPQRYLGPLVILIAIAGVYAVANSMFDVFIMFICGFVGFFLMRLKFNLTPLILGFILGPMLETEWRRTMIMSQGSVSIFTERAGSIFLLLVLVAVVVSVCIGSIRKHKSNRQPAL